MTHSPSHCCPGLPTLTHFAWDSRNCPTKIGPLEWEMLEIFATFSPVSYMISLSQKLPHFQSQAIAPLWGWLVCCCLLNSLAACQSKLGPYFFQHSNQMTFLWFSQVQLSLLTGNDDLSFIMPTTASRVNKFVRTAGLTSQSTKNSYG